MVEITIFELNLDGAEFTANAPGSGPVEGEPAGTDDTDGGGLPVGLVLAVVGAVVASVVAVVVAKKLRGDEESASATPV